MKPLWTQTLAWLAAALLAFLLALAAPEGLGVSGSGWVARGVRVKRCESSLRRASMPSPLPETLSTA